ncbi:murein transglycosylase A [Caenispirillum salinarum]|uniref:murein transglycosylase A n=1 Tax=Caenispirillum salinarum TaxID=859058 RepID=UPI00384CB672
MRHPAAALPFRLSSAVRRAAAVAGLAAALAACGERPAPEPTAEGPPTAVLTRVSFEALPGFGADPVAEALPALDRSCERMAARNAWPDSAPSGLAEPSRGLWPGADAWRAACAALLAVPKGDDAALRRVLMDEFAPYAVADPARKPDDEGPATPGTFTGYYEAELKAAREQGGPYQTPVYGVPQDLVTINPAAFDDSLPSTRLVGRVEDGRLVRYWTRAEIETGALEGRAPVLLWAESPVDLHVLHIQGSGRVALADGSTTRIGYAGNNGWGFVGIGRVMLDRGLVEPGKASMQDIRAWLKANPDQADSVMQANPRYIFFREITGAGPIGAQGVPLTPRRSMAVDPRFIAYGTPLWLDTVDPDGRLLQRLMVAQDTGSAIRGQVRGDFFWGTGEAALEHAGRMKSTGRYYVLLPKATGTGA